MTREDIRHILELFFTDGGTIGVVKEVLNELAEKEHQALILACDTCKFFRGNRCTFPGAIRGELMGGCSGYRNM